jgi:outer membrane lipoprotein-sorting protein
MWIHKATFIPVKVEYYDAKGEKIREAQAMEVKQIQGFPTVVTSVMKDLRTGSVTTITYSKVEYNIELTQDLFTERYLRNPPRAYLR